MNKNLLESYKKIASKKDKSENEALEEVLNNSLSIIDLQEVLKQYLTKISKLETEFERSKNDIKKNLDETNRTNEEIKQIKKEFERSKNDIKKNLDETNRTNEEIKQIKKELDKKINSINTILFWILVVFFLAALGFYFELYVNFSWIKADYIDSKKEVEKQIELFKKEQEELKEDNKKLKENIKNEIEKDIYKTILDTTKN